MRWLGLLGVVMLATNACALLPPPVPDSAYFPDTKDPRTRRLSETLYRAAVAAGDDPAHYSFAMLQTAKIVALTHEEGIFYFSEGLADQSSANVDALVAREVAHEVLGHVGTRRAVSLGVSGGFAVVGFVVPGLGLMDFLVNPVVVRAFTRDQSFDADQKALEILLAMGHQTPRRTLTAALKAAAALNGTSEGAALLATEPDLDDRLIALEPLEAEPAGLAKTVPPKR